MIDRLCNQFVEAIDTLWESQQEDVKDDIMVDHR